MNRPSPTGARSPRRAGRWLDLPARAPRLTLIAIAATTLALGVPATQFRVNSAVDQLLPTNDPDRLFYEGVKSAFGSEEIGVVALFADDVFAPETLARIVRLDTDLSRIEGVREVTSLATLETIELGERGLTRQGLMPQLPLSGEQKETFRRSATAHPLGLRAVVSADGRATALLVRFEAMDDAVFLGRGIEAEMRAIVARHPGPEAVAITGLPTIKVHAAKALLQDLTLFVPAGFLVVIAVLVHTFRTWVGVLLPLSTVLIGLVWTTGVMVLTGGTYSMGTVVLPPLLLCVGIAYAIHIVSRYYVELSPERSAAEALGAAMAHIRLPLVMAWITTLVGFASFLSSPIPSIRDFGLYSCFGISAILVAGLAVIPAALTLFPTPTRQASPLPEDDWASRIVRRGGRLATRYRRPVLVVFSAIMAAGLWETRHIQVETDYIRFFGPADPVRRDNSLVAEALAGTQLIVVTIDGQGPESITRLPVVDALRDLQQLVDAEPKVDKTVSLLDHLYLLRRAIEPELAGEPITDQRKLDQLLLLLNPQNTRQTVNRDFSRATLTAHTRLSASEEVRQFVRRVEAFAAGRFPPGVRVHATGVVVLLNRSADTVVNGQVSGLFQVVPILLVLMVALFRSLGLGVLSMIPNVLPVIVLFGLMGFLGIDLNVSTSMIACISIGIAVDDTIHYMITYNTWLRRGAAPEAAVLETAREVGRPIVVTGFALAVGFLVVCVSNFQPIRHFGALSGVTMIVGVIAELFFTPALLLTFARRVR